MATTTIPSLIDRADIHKSCKSLETVASILVNYTETLNSLVSINKKLAKALRETAGVKGTNGIPANTLNTSACIFEAIHEVDTKFVKIVDKEVDSLGDEIKKWFKKLAKEEKAHDERLAASSAKLKQAGQAYEKKSKRKDADLSEEHARYLAVLNTLGPEMTQDKQNHASFVTHRHTTLISHVAASVSRLAETEWGRACEHVRKFAPFVGSIGECRALCEGGWNSDLPPDLSDDPSNKSTPLNNESPNQERSAMPEQLSSGSALPSTSASLSSPLTSITVGHSPIATSSPQNAVRSRSNTLQVMDNSPKREISRSPKQILLSAPERDDFKQSVSEPSTPVNTTSDPPVLQRSLSPLGHAPGTITEEPEELQEQQQRSARESSLESDSKDSSTQSRVSNAHPANFSNVRTSSKPQAPTAKVSLEHIVEVSKPPRPLPLPSPRAIHRVDLERIQSTDSLSNKIASIRDRYDSKMTDISVNQSPRDLPRPGQRVAELANRYTSSPPRIDSAISSQTVLSNNGHFPTFQERFGRGHKVNAGVDKPPPEAYRQELEQGSYSTREDEVLRYSGVTLQDRDRGYPGRGPEERLPVSRAESTYYDELGVRTRSSGAIDALELRAREALLLEQERRLEVEREKLMSARESVVADATPAYSRRYSDSPHPFNSHQAMHLFGSQGQGMPSPENHPSDCDCLRCTQLYASNTSRQGPVSSSSTALLSPLRPGDDNKRWRRLSTGPAASFKNLGRSLGMSIGNVSSPNIPHTSLPPDNSPREDRRLSFDIMNNRDLFANDRSVFTRR